MSGYGRNSRHGSDQHRFNHPQKGPCCPTRIACRVCGQIFMSTQALINHVECHLIEDETPSRSQHEMNHMPYQREINPFVNRPFQSSLPLPITPQEPPPFLKHNYSLMQCPRAERNPSFNATQLIHVSPSTPPPHVLQPLARRSYTIGPWPIPSVQQDERRVLLIEESPSYHTKPYLNQLDHPIPEIVEVDESDEENDSDKLDLTLKL